MCEAPSQLSRAKFLLHDVPRGFAPQESSEHREPLRSAVHARGGRVGAQGAAKHGAAGGALHGAAGGSAPQPTRRCGRGATDVCGRVCAYQSRRTCSRGGTARELSVPREHVERAGQGLGALKPELLVVLGLSRARLLQSRHVHLQQAGPVLSSPTSAFQSAGWADAVDRLPAQESLLGVRSLRHVRWCRLRLCRTRPPPFWLTKTCNNDDETSFVFTDETSKLVFMDRV